MDATLKERNLKQSIKKFFVDGLPGRSPNFDKILTPDLVSSDTTQWLSLLLEASSLETVSDAHLSIFLFSRKDKEGDALSIFGDEIIELVHDQGNFDLFDVSELPWVKIGGVNIHLISSSNSDSTPDGTKMKWIQTMLKWTALW